MAHAVRGLLLLSVYSGGFSAVCLICHFNVSVRRFNAWRYHSIPPQSRLPCGRCLWPYCVALSSAPWLAACAASLPPSLFSCGLVGGRPLLWRGGLGGLRWLLRRAWRSAKVAGKVSGKVAKVAGIVARLSAKVATKVAVKVASASPKSLIYPKIIVVYKIPCIKAGFFLPTFP